MDQSVKVAGTEGKVGGFFCRLPPLNENTETGQYYLRITQSAAQTCIELQPIQCI